MAVGSCWRAVLNHSLHGPPAIGASRPPRSRLLLDVNGASVNMTEPAAATSQRAAPRGDAQGGLPKPHGASWVRSNPRPLATAGDEQVVSAGMALVPNPSNVGAAARTDTRPDWLATSSR